MTKNSLFAFGDIVLVVFPFTDVKGEKKRPALVLHEDFNDLTLARVTSQPINSEYDINIEMWEKAGLMLPSIIKLEKIATLAKPLIDTKLGMLNEADMAALKNKIKEILTELSK